ncbi:hypothetical protein GCM10022223_06660 [Kineosporia mesophila]|uniref:Ligand-binding protein with streptavidin-like fold n=1 Tax=Kineosporia mesophila TaxID=566012 RepID=A0ABP6Z469_9ACTN|nr:Atu4866 domain-containing protein [Kineosporia mesophila]MCD5351045.1 Atu4866 domain-containing protein [Kineosporia mesophila]
MTDLLLTEVTVLTVSSTSSSIPADVRVTDGRIAAVGGVQRQPTARPTRTTRTIDGRGATVVPLVQGTLEQLVPAAERFRDKEIAVGNEACFVVVDRPVTQREALGALIVRPADLRAVVLDGEVVVTRGGAEVFLEPLPEGDARLGIWIDRTGYLHQELDGRGRYDETRAGRRHAWEGQYWVRGNRVVYLDDTGFWAFGEFSDAELHHAGYVMSLGE